MLIKTKQVKHETSCSLPIQESDRSSHYRGGYTGAGQGSASSPEKPTLTHMMHMNRFNLKYIHILGIDIKKYVLWLSYLLCSNRLFLVEYELTKFLKYFKDSCFGFQPVSMLMQVYWLLLIQVLYYTSVRHRLTSELIHEQLIRRSQCLASVCHTHEEVPVNISLYYFLFVVNYP